MSSSRVSFGLPLGCGSAIGLLALALVTGTIILNIPSLAAPVRFEITAAAAAGATPLSTATQQAPVSIVPTLPSLALPIQTSSVGPSPTAISLNPWDARIPAAACIPTDLPQTARVVGVMDGETIRVLMDRDQLVYTVRYIGIDLPAARDLKARQNAADRNVQLTDGQSVLMVRDLTDQDSFGRLPRYVMVGNTFVNYELIAGGFVTARPTPPDSACDPAFQAAQQRAQSSQLGIWSPLSPTP